MDHPYSKPFSAGPGSKVHLLVNSKRVGVGTTTGVNLLHGHEIPPEYAAVSIEKIDPNICPMYMTSFDEPFCMLANSQHGQLHNYRYILQT